MEGSEINDDPLTPLSPHAKERIKVLGDETLITWLHRDDRYVEKLATPDVSVADIIGDVDPIKAATLKLPYADERVIHYGMIPRAKSIHFRDQWTPRSTNQGSRYRYLIFSRKVICKSGLQVRLPLDILFLFTANPEDYTNRAVSSPHSKTGSIARSSHYPLSIWRRRWRSPNKNRESNPKIKIFHLPSLAQSTLRTDLLLRLVPANSDINSEYLPGLVSAHMKISSVQ